MAADARVRRYDWAPCMRIVEVDFFEASLDPQQVTLP